MNLLRKTRRKGKSKSDKTQPDASEKESKKLKDPLAWLSNLDDDALVRVYSGGHYVSSFEPVDLDGITEPLEEIILRELGPGDFRLVAFKDGKSASKITIRVGSANERATILQPPHKNDREAVQEVLGAVERRLEALETKPKVQVNLAELLPAILPTTLQFLQGNATQMAELMSKMQKDPPDITSMLTAVTTVMKDIQSMQPPAIIESTAPQEGGDVLTNIINGLVQYLRPQQPQLAGPDGTPEQPPSAPRRRRSFNLDDYIRKIKEVIQQGSSAQDIAMTILAMVDTVTQWGFRHPLIDRFHDDPGAAFDDVAGQIAEFQGAEGRPLALEVRAIIVDRVQQVLEQQPPEPDAASNPDGSNVGESVEEPQDATGTDSR